MKLHSPIIGVYCLNLPQKGWSCHGRSMCRSCTVIGCGCLPYSCLHSDGFHGVDSQQSIFPSCLHGCGGGGVAFAVSISTIQGQH
uniref:Uncharacterized protein n=1 Tax=Anguilla anguilla TaxID=7936 RepID=A0A0E9WZI8_ANGAN